MLPLVGDMADGWAIPSHILISQPLLTPGQSASPKANHTPIHTSDMAAWAGGRGEKGQEEIEMSAMGW